MRVSIRNMVLAAFFIALGIVLPFLTGQIPEIGAMLSPMHISVLLCGFVLGGPTGAAVGFITPLLRSTLLGMPPPYPTAAAMAFELAVYGLLAGLFYRLFPKKPLYVYISLILSMLGGRVIWGLAMLVLTGIKGNTFTFAAFLGGAFIKAWPGIVLHIILIPTIIILLERAKLLRRD